MRTSLIVVIFGLAVGAAGITEWASRRPPDTQSTRETLASTPKVPAMDPGDGSAAARRRSFALAEAPASDPGKATGGDNPVLVIGGGAGVFRANAMSLSEQLTDAIDRRFAGPDASELICAHFVIEGHTDNLGSKEVNERVGLSRALAVRQYLTERYEIPRDAMRVVSYGGDQPVADNATPEGRALNRRVVIRMVDHSH
jgi:hypothetical protein